MIPILYPEAQITFFDNGIGPLSDAITCKCTEVLNDSYEIELTYPVDGMYASRIIENRIIKVKPNYFDEPQPFRIYSVEKDEQGIISVKAAHLSYDTAGIPIMPFTSDNIEDSIGNLNVNRNTFGDSLFEVSSDFAAEGNMVVEEPTSLRALLGGNEKSLSSIYGGDFHYDWYSIELLERRGRDKGICFRSVKNVLTFNQESNSEETYSAVFGYWKKNEDTLVYSDIVTIDNSLLYEKTFILNVTSEDLGLSGSTVPTEDQLTEYVQKYIEDRKLGRSKYSMNITYAEDDEITKVNLGDTVRVLIPECFIKAVARCNKVVFDCLAERNESIELGDVDAGLAGEIAALSD